MAAAGRVASILSGVLSRRPVADFVPPPDRHERRRPRRHVRGYVRLLRISRATISRRSRQPRSYRRTKCFQRRYFAIILALGKRRATRPLFLRRIGDAGIRQAATSAAEMAVSVLPARVRAAAAYGPRACAGGRCGIGRVLAREIPGVSFRISHLIWHVRISCNLRIANTERWTSRKERR